MAELFKKCMKVLLCFIFEAVIDVVWKSFLVCLITWMLNFFQINYFNVDTHEHLILEVYTSLVNVRDLSKIFLQKMLFSLTVMDQMFLWKGKNNWNARYLPKNVVLCCPQIKRRNSLDSSSVDTENGWYRNRPQKSWKAYLAVS